MIKAIDARNISNSAKTLKKEIIMSQLESLVQTPNEKILNIEKKIKEAIKNGQDFVFISFLNEEIDLYTEYFKMYGYSLSLQSFLPTESCYRLYW